MNFDEYKSEYFSLYEEFADTVRKIVENALYGAKNLPRPQSIQCRAKGIQSLRQRLTEAGELDTQTLEIGWRDLAGARLIFYTNNDVERFLASPLIRENFEIEPESIKIHHPAPENDGLRYRARHYTVRLREDRTRLPEYARFAGLRCEIQVQTILNHAWSETSHDIVYKNKMGAGYGGKVLKSIARRFDRIMDEHLIPAGFEIQKAQQDYERVLQGKELFDKDIATLLGKAQNNNELHELLSGLKDYAIPNFDDVPDAYSGLKEPLLKAAKTARETEQVPIETSFGTMPGYNPEDVTRLILQIVDSLRYADAIGTLKLLIELYRGEASSDIREAILKNVQNLSEYNLSAYNQVGVHLQLALVDHLATMRAADIEEVRPICNMIYRQVLELEITGTEWNADSMVIKTGTLPFSTELSEIRQKSIDALLAAIDQSTSASEKRELLSVLDTATMAPYRSSASNELLAVTIKDATCIVEFVTDRSSAFGFELLQHVERQFLRDYHRAVALRDDQTNQHNCKTEAEGLIAAIFKFRDKINHDSEFIMYKVLVGFESVYPHHWSEEHYDYRLNEEYRKAEVDRYIEQVSTTNESEWGDFLAMCAQTDSNDLATFPVLGSFISKLSATKPEIAERLLANSSARLLTFLPGFLNGLAAGERPDIYRRVVDAELDSARNLTSVAYHLRHKDGGDAALADRILVRAIGLADQLTATECLLYALENYGTHRIIDSDTFVGEALSFLNERKNASWASQAWFLEKVTRFYDELTPSRTKQLMENLGFVRQVDFRTERILTKVAERNPEAVWDYFEARLQKDKAQPDDSERYEAVPFRLTGLEKELSKHPQLAIRKGLTWFKRDRSLFRFRGGRILSGAFPDCPPEFAAELLGVVRSGDELDADFVLAILQNYRGVNTTHEVLKEIVARFPGNTAKASGVSSVLDDTGVVRGDLGFAEAWRSTRESLKPWLLDERPGLKDFAERHMAQLGLMIAGEEQRAERDREMRNREFESEPEAPRGDGE